MRGMYIYGHVYIQKWEKIPFVFIQGIYGLLMDFCASLLRKSSWWVRKQGDEKRYSIGIHYA